MTNWKALTQKVVSFHEEFKASVVSNSDEPLKQGTILNLTEQEDLFTQNGPKITTKKLRKWLWENKDMRALNREEFILWSAYDEEEDVSYAGVGSYINEKLESRFPPTHLIKPNLEMEAV